MYIIYTRVYAYDYMYNVHLQYRGMYLLPSRSLVASVFVGSRQSQGRSSEEGRINFYAIDSSTWRFPSRNWFFCEFFDEIRVNPPACWHQDTARISISAVDNESSAHLCFWNWVFSLQSHFGAVGEVLTRCGTLRRDKVLPLRSSGSLLTPLHTAPFVITTFKGTFYDPLKPSIPLRGL